MTRLLFTLLLIAFLILLSSPVLAVQWRVLSQVDEMTLVEKKYAYRESSSTPSSETFGKRVSFLASCGEDGRPSLQINWQTYIDNDAFITEAKIDTDPIVRVWAAASTKGTSMFLGSNRKDRVFLSKGDAPNKYLDKKNTKATVWDLNAKLKTAGRVVFRQEDYRGTPYTAVFDFRGFEAVNTEVLGSCL
jgi:hypothetical protein